MMDTLGEGLVPSSVTRGGITAASCLTSHTVTAKNLGSLAGNRGENGKAAFIIKTIATSKSH